MKITIPLTVKKYFWGDDLKQLNWDLHSKYITQTILDKGDVSAVTWLFKQVSANEILQLLPSLKLSTKTRNFWGIYLR